MKVYVAKEEPEIGKKVEEVLEKVGNVVKKTGLDPKMPDIVVVMPREFKPNASTLFVNGEPHTMLINERVFEEKKKRTIAHELIHTAGIIDDTLVEKYLSEIEKEVEELNREVDALFEEIERELRGEAKVVHEQQQAQAVAEQVVAAAENMNVEVVHELPGREILRNPTLFFMTATVLKALERYLAKIGKPIPIALIGYFLGLLASIAKDVPEAVNSFALLLATEVIHWVTR